MKFIDDVLQSGQRLLDGYTASLVFQSLPDQILVELPGNYLANTQNYLFSMAICCGAEGCRIEDSNLGLCCGIQEVGWLHVCCTVDIFSVQLLGSETEQGSSALFSLWQSCLRMEIHSFCWMGTFNVYSPGSRSWSDQCLPHSSIH